MRGRLEPRTAEPLIEFWAEQGALFGERARRRLSEVACVLRDEGRVAGACSVAPAEFALIGGRRFWIYRSLLPGDADEYAEAMVRATFETLEAEFAGEPESPIGLCLLIDEAERRRRSSAVEWLDPWMLYAGYLQDGRQVRIGYFDDASITRGGGHAQPMPMQLGGGWALEGGHRVGLFAEQDTITPGDVTEMWVREGALPPEEARRRVDEVMTVATDADGRLAGVNTAYLQRSDQLRADMWHLRTFIPTAHRRFDLATVVALLSRDELSRRYFSGEDRRALGMLFEVQHEGWKRLGHMARWLPTDFTFIGENPRGDHVRVHYFPGAPAPGG